MRNDFVYLSKYSEFFQNFHKVLKFIEGCCFVMVCSIKLLRVYVK